MPEQVASAASKSGAKSFMRLLTPFAAAGLVLWGWFSPLQARLALADETVRAGATALCFLGLVWVFSVMLSPLFRDKPDGARSFYDAVVDALADPAIVTDAKGRALYANAPYMKLASGAGASRLVGFDVLFSGYPDFAAPIYQLGQAAQSDTAAQRDFRVEAGSSAPYALPDKARWLRLSVAPMPANARGGKTVWRLSDISEDRSRQESAFTRLQYIISYLDQAPVGFFSVLPSGKVDYVNATLAQWLGFELGETQSGKLTLEQLLGARAAKVLTALAPTAEGFRIDQFTLPLSGKKGMAATYALVSRTDFDTGGSVLPLRGVVLKAEGQQALAGNAMAAIPIGHARLDDKLRLLEANAQFLSLSSNLARGADVLAALDEASGKRLGATRLSPAMQPLTFDASFAGAVTKTAALTLVPDGQGYSVFAVDRTESKMMEAQLEQSLKMQAVGKMASGIAHDFNNMLTPILGFADLLLTKMRPTDPSFQDVMAIKQNANRAAGLVRQLLAYSRKQTIQPKPTDLSEQMADMPQLLSRVVGDKVKLSIDYGRGVWPVMVDIHQLEQAIINLAGNSRDAMPSGGAFSLSTYNLSAAEAAKIGYKLDAVDYVVIETNDTGQGIPREIINRIFDPFFTTKDVGKGTGLGLSTVYGFVKQSGGFIYCDSEPGQGTKFRIFLPRISDEAMAEATKPAAVTGPREDFSGRGRILIVEDEDSVRAFAARALSSRGFTVVEAGNGALGLEVLEDDKQGFELILSDVVMPEMDGPAMLKEIRARGIKSKFIFMSGYAEDAFERNPDSPTDFGFIQKPFTLKQLVEKVKTELG